MGKTKLMWQILILISVLGIMGCTQYVSPVVIKTSQDMDNIVNLKGVPRNLKESFFGGPHDRHHVSLYYPDALYQFQTDAQKSYTVLLGSSTASLEMLPQNPIPLWFKVKYPNLNWEGIPTK